MAKLKKKTQTKINSIAPKRLQSTHWYQTKWGWTAQPHMASREEVEARGLHECTFLGCKEKHAGSAEEYRYKEILQEAKTEGRAKEVRAQKAVSNKRTLRRKKLARRK